MWQGQLKTFILTWHSVTVQTKVLCSEYPDITYLPAYISNLTTQSIKRQTYGKKLYRCYQTHGYPGICVLCKDLVDELLQICPQLLNERSHGCSGIKTENNIMRCLQVMLLFVSLRFLQPIHFRVVIQWCRHLQVRYEVVAAICADCQRVKLRQTVD